MPKGTSVGGLPGVITAQFVSLVVNTSTSLPWSGATTVQIAVVIPTVPLAARETTTKMKMKTFQTTEAFLNRNEEPLADNKVVDN